MTSGRVKDVMSQKRSRKSFEPLANILAVAVYAGHDELLVARCGESISHLELKWYFLWLEADYQDE
jgi:hypothetical protein